MYRQTFGIVLLIVAALSAPAYANSIEAFSGVIAGLNECSGGGTPAGMYAFFGAASGFGIGSTQNGSNGISDCGLAGGIQDMFSPAGPANSQYALNYVGFAGLGVAYNGTAQATTQYGHIEESISGALSGQIYANGVAESAAYGISPDMWDVQFPSGPSPATGYASLTFGLDASGGMTSPVGGALETEVVVQVGTDTPETIFQAGVGSGYSFALNQNTGPQAGCTTTATSYSCVGATLTTGLLPVTFGSMVPYNFGMILGADFASGGSTDPDITLTGIQFYDANGNPLSNFTITSASGAVYGADGIEAQPPSSAPEPSTFLLVGGALLAIGWRLPRGAKRR